MKYSQFHRNTNPISAARLDEAFNASKMEGGPGDPVKVEVKKDKEAGKVTITKSSKGESGKSYEEAYKSADKSKYPTFSDFKKAAESYNKENPSLKNRLQNASVTLEKLPYLDSPELKPIDQEDIKFDFSKVPTSSTGGGSAVTSTNKTRQVKQDVDPKKSKIDFKNYTITSSGPNTPSVEPKHSCPKFDKSCKEKRAVNKQKRIDNKNKKIKNKEDRKEIKLADKNYKARQKNSSIKFQHDHQERFSKASNFFNEMAYYNKNNPKPKSRTIKASF